MENFSNSYNSPNMGEANNKSGAWFVVVGILVLVAVIYFLYAKGWILMGGEKIDDNTVLYQEDTGKITKDFPSELLLEEGIAVSNSYSISYLNEDINLPVASYFSGKSMEENVTMFGQYLEESGWQILQEAKVDSPAPFFYAKKGNADLNITFQKKDGKVFVVIAYSTKQ
ncbi:MAG: hypothetical protein AAB840_01175 [Patescibacteria group bacterium]